MRPRVAARSPMSGAQLRATNAVAAQYRGHVPPPDMRSQVIDECGRPWSRRSPRACRCGLPARSHFADERRIVVDDGGGRVRTQNAHPVPSIPLSDPVSDAGARTDNARLSGARASPPSVAQRPRVAARSSMSGASWAGDASGWVRTRTARPAPSDLKVQRCRHARVLPPEGLSRISSCMQQASSRKTALDRQVADRRSCVSPQDRCAEDCVSPRMFPTCQRVEAGGGSDGQGALSRRRPPLTLAPKTPPGRLLHVGGECAARNPVLHNSVRRRIDGCSQQSCASSNGRGHKSWRYR